MRTACIAALAAFALPLAAQLSPCPPQGLTLSVQGATGGDSWQIALAGLPGAKGFLFFDAAAGPVALPYGNFCVGFSSGLIALPIALPPSGALALAGVLPLDPALAGQHSYCQAAAAHPIAGVLLSNGWPIGFHDPHYHLIAQGTLSPFGGLPAQVYAYDQATLAFSPPLPLGARPVHALRVPEFGWIALVREDGHLVCLDEDTHATVLDVAIGSSPSAPARLAITDTPGELLVLQPGAAPGPFGPGLPGAVRLVQLPAGQIAQTTWLVSGNPSDLIAIPGSKRAFLRESDQLRAIDYAQGFDLAPIDMGQGFGPLVDFQRDGARVIALLAGVPSSGVPAALNAVDAFTLQVEHAQPVALQLPGAATRLRRGPSPLGDALVVLLPDIGGAGAAAFASPQTLLGQLALALPKGTTRLELSPGGTQWIALAPGAPNSPFGGGSFGQLASYAVANLAPAQSYGLAKESQAELALLPSAVLRRGLFTTASGGIGLFTTDPLGTPTLIMPLPGGGPLLVVAP